ncbi:MAG: hypothetical protein H8E94_04485 [Alphaproteobacteria bacterium]|nr:hypothetical protein [Alphaproteobacteria bacterium]
MIFRGAFWKYSSRLAGLAAFMALMACGAVAQDRLSGFLGTDIIEVITTAERVEPFLLKPSLMPSGATGPGAVSGYEWKARGADLAPAQMSAFKSLVLDEASYDFETAKKCVMVPEYVFRFHAGAKSADVLVAFGCTMWAFGEADGDKVEDFDPVAANLRAIVETVFKLD